MEATTLLYRGLSVLADRYVGHIKGAVSERRLLLAREGS
jgi:hypothetical protein